MFLEALWRPSSVSDSEGSGERRNSREINTCTLKYTAAVFKNCANQITTTKDGLGRTLYYISQYRPTLVRTCVINIPKYSAFAYVCTILYTLHAIASKCHSYIFMEVELSKTYTYVHTDPPPPPPPHTTDTHTKTRTYCF